MIRLGLAPGATGTDEEWTAKLTRAYTHARGRCKIVDKEPICGTCAAQPFGRTKAQGCAGCAYGCLQETWATLCTMECPVFKDADGNPRKLIPPECDAFFFKLALPMVRHGWLQGQHDVDEHHDVTRLDRRNGKYRLRCFRVVNRSEGTMEGAWPTFNGLAPGNNCAPELITCLLYDTGVEWNIGQDNNIRQTFNVGHHDYGLVAAQNDAAARIGQPSPFAVQNALASR